MKLKVAVLAWLLFFMVSTVFYSSSLLKVVSATADPSATGTSTDEWPFGNTFQNNLYYKHLKYWVWYCNGSYMGYKTSLDGSSWSSFYDVRACTYGYFFDMYFDGDYVHYVYSASVNNTSTYYRRGLVNSDNSITWSASEQAVNSAAANMTYEVPVIACDSSGIPYIGYRWYNATSGNRYPYVTRSDYSNGTWSTTSEYPLQLNDTASYWSSNCHVSVIPLTSDKMYVFYTNKTMFSERIYDSGMGSETVVDITDMDNVWGRSLVADGDDVHLVWQTGSTYNITHMQRTYGTGWGSETNVQTDVSQYAIPTLTYASSQSKLYCFWANSSYIRYKKYDLSIDSWDGSETAWVAESDLFWNGTDEDDYRISSSYEEFDNCVQVVWLANQSSPYSIIHDYFHFPTIGEFEAADPVYANKYEYVNATVSDGDGNTTIVNATLELTGGIILKYDNATDTFSEYQDTNGYCTLNASGCLREETNSTSFKLSWQIKLNKQGAGSINVVAANTKVYDEDDSTGSGSESGLYDLKYLSLTLQARDAASANLPRAVTFNGTLGNSTSFSEASSSAGLKALTTCYGTLSVNTWWGDHLVDSAESISLTSNTTHNIDTKIRRLSDGSDYVLMSVNATTIPAITYVSTSELKLSAVTGTGSKELKMDNLNWVETGQPVELTIGAYTYDASNPSWEWDSTNHVFKFPVTFSTVDIILKWSTGGAPSGSSGSSGSSGAAPPTVPIVPALPELPGPEEEIAAPPGLLPEYEPIAGFPVIDTTVVGVGIVVAVIVVGFGYPYLKKNVSLSVLWAEKRNKKRKPVKMKRRKT